MNSEDFIRIQQCNPEIRILHVVNFFEVLKFPECLIFSFFTILVS